MRIQNRNHLEIDPPPPILLNFGTFGDSVIDSQIVILNWARQETYYDHNIRISENQMQ